jgi:putative intracellular protease/amidase
MKKITLLLALFCLTLSCFSQTVQEEELKIRKTLQNYLDGRNLGNPEQLRSAFHESAELRYMKKDSLYTIWPINDYISGVRPGYKHNCKSRIVSIDVLGSAAQAKIEIEYPNWKYADYINLLKMNNEWLIAVKTFSGQEITNNKRILFVLTSHEKMGQTDNKTGLHLGELSHVYKPLFEKGYEIDFVSPKGGATRMYGDDMNDPTNLWFVQNQTAYYKFSNAYRPEEIDPKQYIAIYFVGGHGTMWDLPNNQTLNDITSKIYQHNGVVAAICHGSAGLVNVMLDGDQYLIKGKRVTSFTDKEEKAIGQEDTVPFLLESKLKERGAIFIGAGNWEKNVMVDERLITGQNPASADELAEEMIKLLEK